MPREASVLDVPASNHLCGVDASDSKVDVRRNLVVQSLMQSLLIVELKIATQLLTCLFGRSVVMHVNLSEGVTPSARLQNRT